MIITRTPLRISIGGGGTDLPSYYRQFGGFVIAAAINKHIYVGINETFSGGYFLKYSSLEHSPTIDEIRHPAVRAALQYLGFDRGLELSSFLLLKATLAIFCHGGIAGMKRAKLRQKPCRLPPRDLENT